MVVTLTMLVDDRFAKCYVADGFEAVRDAFRRNFVENGELGASFAAYHNGQLVVDLWGGVADSGSGSPFVEDTLQVIFSGSKGLIGVCLLLLIDRGKLDLAAPVATYWPEFGASGKERITVRELVSHTAGLPGIAEPVEVADLTDFDRIASLLAAQSPLVEPGTLCYHTITYGWLCGELVRRADGRRFSQFFADEVAGPLGLDAWFGLPQKLERRLAVLELGSHWGEGEATGAPDDLVAIVDGNPNVWDREGFAWNSGAFHAAVIPGAGGIATCRSIARLYSCLALRGEIDGVRLLAPESIDLGRRRISGGIELLTGTERSFRGRIHAPGSSLLARPSPGRVWSQRGRRIDARCLAIGTCRILIRHELDAFRSGR